MRTQESKKSRLGTIAFMLASGPSALAGLESTGCAGVKPITPCIPQLEQDQTRNMCSYSFKTKDGRAITVYNATVPFNYNSTLGIMGTAGLESVALQEASTNRAVLRYLSLTEEQLRSVDNGDNVINGSEINKAVALKFPRAKGYNVEIRNGFVTSFTPTY